MTVLLISHLILPNPLDTRNRHSTHVSPSISVFFPERKRVEIKLDNGGHHQDLHFSSIFTYIMTNNYFDFEIKVSKVLNKIWKLCLQRASKKKKKIKKTSERMSLRGWNKGKSSTTALQRKKEGEKRGEEGGVSISQPRSPLENLISIPSIQQLYQSLIFDKG